MGRIRQPSANDQTQGKKEGTTVDLKEIYFRAASPTNVAKHMSQSVSDIFGLLTLK